VYTVSFTFVRPKSLTEAEAAFRASAEARYISGGQTLIPTMKLRLAAPSELIDLSSIPALDSIRREGELLIIGAGARHADVASSKIVCETIPALAALAGGIGDPAVRHRGTLGGSIANNDPAADYPAALAALGASVTTTRRTLSVEEFFTGMFVTALEDGEIVTEIAFPVPQRVAYAKFPQPASRFAMVGVFVASFKDGVRVAVTGAGPGVFRIAEMEKALTRQFAPEAIKGIRIPATGLTGDLHGSPEYRAHLVTVMAGRAVAEAIGGRDV